ncbi:NAD(P)H-dependent oxidoreductase [Variovorax sp. LjRoot290]|uniref:NAD(P)H-dependent oxidoreductase n=1 Tax=unclassified Variovorax TaxID=663243 RepID=UPI003ECE1F0F
MAKRILIIQGHPDGSTPHLCHALSEAYAQGARSAGHVVETIDVGQLDFPLLRSKSDWDKGTLPQSLMASQLAIKSAEHLVFFFPLWLGGMPALLKGFLEQVMRPAVGLFADGGTRPGRPLSGRSARIVITMGMPASLYRWYFRAHSLKALKRSILGFVGVAPVRDTLIGAVDAMDGSRCAQWIERLHDLGRRAA